MEVLPHQRSLTIAFDDGGSISEEVQLQGQDRLNIVIGQLAALCDLHSLNRYMTVGQLLDMDQSCLLDTPGDMARVIHGAEEARDY